MCLVLLRVRGQRGILHALWKRSGASLPGMRERVRLYGGLLDAQATPDGGWRVHATLPLGVTR